MNTFTLLDERASNRFNNTVNTITLLDEPASASSLYSCLYVLKYSIGLIPGCQGLYDSEGVFKI
jgi:hypothetical protein